MAPAGLHATAQFKKILFLLAVACGADVASCFGRKLKKFFCFFLFTKRSASFSLHLKHKKTGALPRPGFFVG
jgi:hypothetical protein